MKPTLSLVLAFLLSCTFLFSQECDNSCSPKDMLKCCPLKIDLENEGVKSYLESLTAEKRDAFLKSVSLQDKNTADEGQMFKSNANAPKGYIGIEFNSEGSDNIISHVKRRSAAEQAGIQIGDQVLSINETQTPSFKIISELMQNKKAGEYLALVLLREGEKIDKTVRLRRKHDPANIDWMLRSVTACEPNQTKSETSKQITTVTEDKIIDSKLELKDFKASPNPARDFIRIQFKADTAPTKIKFVDMSGRSIYTESLLDFSGQYDRTINLNTIPGIVIISIHQENKVHQEKLVISN